MQEKKPNSLQNEIIRMLRISNFETNKPCVKENMVIKQILKEDFTSELNDMFEDPEFDDSQQQLSTGGEKAILPIELKAAMLAHTVSEYQAALLGLYTNWESKTKGAEVNIKQGTFVSKSPIDKLPRQSQEKDRIDKLGINPIAHTPHANYEKEWIKIIKSQRVPVTFVEDNIQTREMTPIEKKESAKWLDRKTYDIISYRNGLTPLGKAQIEFLVRAYTGKPANEQEKQLFNLLGDGGYHFKETSEEILRQFYSLALIPHIMKLTRRAKYNPNDVQLHEFIEEGVDHALNQLESHYDSNRGNIGTFIISVAKNSVKNQIIDISDYRIDLSETNEYLMNNRPPYIITSTASPEEVSDENYVSVRLYKKSEPTQSNANSDQFLKSTTYKPKQAKNIYAYTYDDPNAVIRDLSKDARFGTRKKDSTDKGATPENTVQKLSPLSERFLTSNWKQVFYKSFAPQYDEVKKTMGWDNDINPEETYSIFQVAAIPDAAKKKVDEIFTRIIKLWYVNEQKIKAGQTAADWSKQTGQPEVDGKHNDESARAISNRITIAKNSQILKELMFDVLNYGELVLVYTRAWEMKSETTPGKSSWAAIGDAVVLTTDASGKKTPKPNIKGEPLNINDTELVWHTRVGLKEYIQPVFLNKFLAKMNEKFPHDSKEMKYLYTYANDIINKTLRAIRYYFGNLSTDSDIRQNKKDLYVILQNYAAAASSNQPWTQVDRPKERAKRTAD